MAFRQYSGLSGSRPEKLLILGFESSTFTYISMLKKFGHFLMNSSRDTGGLQEPPPVRGKDILIPYGIGLKPRDENNGRGRRHRGGANGAFAP